MTQSAYSWMGTRIHLVLEDEIADAYNRAQDAFFKAQEDYKIRYGFAWNPYADHPTITIFFPEEIDYDAWHGVANVINALIKLNNGLDIPESEITSDYLIKL